MNFQPNQIIDNRYILEAYRGKGAYAEVWSAHEKGGNINEKYALKLFNSKERIDDRDKRDFEDEFEKAKQFNHPHILSPLKQGIHNGITPYFVMPLCKGSLMDEFRDRQFNPDNTKKHDLRNLFEERELLNIIEQIASALDATYYSQVVHNDIKPQNILIYEEKDDFGNIHQIKYMLADFGISKFIGDTIRMTQNLKAEHLSSMSPAYAAPEKFGTVDKATFKSDVFSLGFSLYEIVEGRLLHGAEPLGKILWDRPNTVIPPITANYSDGFKQLIYRCLEREEDKRPTPSTIVKEVANIRKQGGSSSQSFLDIISDSLINHGKSIAIVVFIIVALIIGGYYLIGNAVDEAISCQKKGDFKHAIEALDGYSKTREIDSLRIKLAKLKIAVEQYDKIEPYNGKLAKVKKGEYWGLINWDLDEVGNHCNYNAISSTDPTEDNQYYFYRHRNNYFGLFDSKGNDYKAKREVRGIEKVKGSTLRIKIINDPNPINIDCEDFIKKYRYE